MNYRDLLENNFEIIQKFSGLFNKKFTGSEVEYKYLLEEFSEEVGSFRTFRPRMMEDGYNYFMTLTQQSKQTPEKPLITDTDRLRDSRSRSNQKDVQSVEAADLTIYDNTTDGKRRNKPNNQSRGSQGSPVFSENQVGYSERLETEKEARNSSEIHCIDLASHQVEESAGTTARFGGAARAQPALPLHRRRSFRRSEEFCAGNITSSEARSCSPSFIAETSSRTTLSHKRFVRETQEIDSNNLKKQEPNQSKKSLREQPSVPGIGILGVSRSNGDLYSDQERKVDTNQISEMSKNKSTTINNFKQSTQASRRSRPRLTKSRSHRGIGASGAEINAISEREMTIRDEILANYNTNTLRNKSTSRGALHSYTRHSSKKKDREEPDEQAIDIIIKEAKLKASHLTESSIGDGLSMADGSNGYFSQFSVRDSNSIFSTANDPLRIMNKREAVLGIEECSEDGLDSSRVYQAPTEQLESTDSRKVYQKYQTIDFSRKIDESILNIQQNKRRTQKEIMQLDNLSRNHQNYFNSISEKESDILKSHGSNLILHGDLVESTVIQHTDDTLPPMSPSEIALETSKEKEPPEEPKASMGSNHRVDELLNGRMELDFSKTINLVKITPEKWNQVQKKDSEKRSASRASKSPTHSREDNRSSIKLLKKFSKTMGPSNSSLRSCISKAYKTDSSELSGQQKYNKFDFQIDIQGTVGVTMTEQQCTPHTYKTASRKTRGAYDTETSGRCLPQASETAQRSQKSQEGSGKLVVTPLQQISIHTKNSQKQYQMEQAGRRKQCFDSYDSTSYYSDKFSRSSLKGRGKENSRPFIRNKPAQIHSATENEESLQAFLLSSKYSTLHHSKQHQMSTITSKHYKSVKPKKRRYRSEKLGQSESRIFGLRSFLKKVMNKEKELLKYELDLALKNFKESESYYKKIIEFFKEKQLLNTGVTQRKIKWRGCQMYWLTKFITLGKRIELLEEVQWVNGRTDERLSFMKTTLIGAPKKKKYYGKPSSSSKQSRVYSASQYHILGNRGRKVLMTIPSIPADPRMMKCLYLNQKRVKTKRRKFRSIYGSPCLMYLNSGMDMLYVMNLSTRERHGLNNPSSPRRFYEINDGATYGGGSSNHNTKNRREEVISFLTYSENSAKAQLNNSISLTRQTKEKITDYKLTPKKIVVVTRSDIKLYNLRTLNLVKIIESREQLITTFYIGISKMVLVPKFGDKLKVYCLESDRSRMVRFNQYSREEGGVQPSQNSQMSDSHYMSRMVDKDNLNLGSFLFLPENKLYIINKHFYIFEVDVISQLDRS